MKFKITNLIEKDKLLKSLITLDLEKQWIVSIELYRNKRTTDQNSLYWLWIEAIVLETGNEKEYLHEYFKDKYLAKEEKLIFESNVKPRISTAKLNTKEFTIYLDKIQLFVAEELGITLPYREDNNFEQFINEYKLTDNYGE